MCVSRIRISVNGQSMLKETNVTKYLLHVAVKYGADPAKTDLCVIMPAVMNALFETIAYAIIPVSGKPVISFLRQMLSVSVL